MFAPRNACCSDRYGEIRIQRIGNVDLESIASRLSLNVCHQVFVSLICHGLVWRRSEFEPVGMETVVLDLDERVG